MLFGQMPRPGIRATATISHPGCPRRKGPDKQSTAAGNSPVARNRVPSEEPDRRVSGPLAGKSTAPKTPRQRLP
ncbi:hypothetical protein LZ32DRAFT_317601 [Colletotrichum eremochloae]|nr:hypothetical protein LZ32DRAFT_317601 [Colletotrichum eremochloae]